MFIVLVFGVNGVSAVNVTPEQVVNASENVNSYITINHTLPSNTQVGGNQVDMPQYLELSTAAVLNINAGSQATIPIQSYSPAPSPSESITSRDFSKAEYLELASRVQSFMETNGRAPNYASTSTGNIGYQSLVYMYARILDSYQTNEVLPDYIRVDPWTTVLNSDVIGSTSYGYVEKKVYGNQSSLQTIALIIGVHPQENGIHNTIFNALTTRSLDLTKRYVLYKVTVTQDADDYSKGRMNGQLLAQAFIVPDVASENPILVLDNHENHGADSGYEYYRFLYPISNTETTLNYANQITSQIPSLVVYYPPNPTSPQYVTMPIANQGINTIIYEAYFYDSLAQKTADANALLDALDGLGDTPTIPLNISITGDPYTGWYLNITNNDPHSFTIYYTTDGSDPETSTTRTEYTTPLLITINTLLRISMVDVYGNWYPILNETFTLDVNAPVVTASLAGGIYYTPQNVVLQALDDQDGNPTIYYTIDGSDPRTSTTREQYTAPINVSSSLILNYYSVDGTGHESAVYTEVYSIYKTVSYSYTVKVPYKKGWYKYWYKVSYKKWYKSWYKYRGKWRYKWKYQWAVKSKYKWKYGWIYRKETRWGTKNVLT